jgi:hypothetical protein
MSAAIAGTDDGDRQRRQLLVERHLGVDTLLLGLALPDDNPHSPNEKFDPACYTTGMRMGAFLWPELSKALARV